MNLSAGQSPLNLLLRLDNLKELCISGWALPDLWSVAVNKPDKVAASSVITNVVHRNNSDFIAQAEREVLEVGSFPGWRCGNRCL